VEKCKRRGSSLSAGLSLFLTPVSVLLLQAPVWAQDAKTAANANAAPANAAATSGRPDELQIVTVTGIRAGLRSAVEVKRDAIQVVDAISAEDIGDFPDKNMSEALQRITGVQISRQDGEGRGVSIRGADPGLNRVEINGVTALSETVTGGRDVDFRDLPVEFVNRLEVIKSATPDMTEGGVGGTVRVITRRPFDSTEPYLAGSAQMVYSDLAESYDPKYSLIGSRTFMDDKFGVLFGASYEKRHLNSNNARTTGWLRRAPTPTGPGATPGRSTDVNGDGVFDWIPDLPRDIMDRRETKRRALLGIFEWRPVDSMTLYAEGSYAKAREDVSSMFMQLAANAGLIDYANTRLGEDNTITHIELTSSTLFPMDLAYRNINGSLDRQQYTTALGGKWGTDNLKVDGRLTYAATDVQNDEKNSTATIFGVPRAVVDYTNGQRAPNMSFPGLDVTTGQLVNNLAAVFNPRTNTQDEKSAQFNVEWLPSSSWFTSLKGGVDVRELSMDSLLFSRTIQLSSRATPPPSGGATTTVAVPQAVIQNTLDSFSGVNDISFFKTGDLGYDGGIRFWNDNRDPTYDATIAASGLTLDPYGPNANAGTNGTFQNYLDTWVVTEKTKAGYVQGSFRFFDESPVPVRGTVGVRYVDTDTNSTGFNRVVIPPNVTFPVESRDGGYKKWLPSLNMRFDFSEKVVGRLTAGKVLARPNPNQLAFRRTLDTSVNFTGSRGNPDLKPFEARQYDLGIEWYFSEDGFASLTGFRKEISQFITNLTSFEDSNTQQPCVFATAPLGTCFSITRPINGTDKVNINGVEAGAQYAFTFLPKPWDGFGALANITYQKDKGYAQLNAPTQVVLTTFPGLSRLSYNYSMYYENQRFSIRASYNWREQWLITPSGRGGLPEYNEDFGSLDASASYNVTPSITLFLEGINLTDEDRIENNSDVRRIGNETYGSRYFLGVRAKL
jgi:iron complex outermembrane recepter protein